MIIDVDAHWELARYPNGELPLGPLRSQLPRDLELLAFAVAGDLLAALPEQKRPTPRELLPKIVEMAEQSEGRAALHPEHESSSAERRDGMARRALASPDPAPLLGKGTTPLSHRRQFGHP